MVEGQGWQGLHGPPACLGGIVGANHGGLGCQGVEGDSDDTPTRVAVDFGEGSYLVDVADSQTRLLHELTAGAGLGGLVHLHESARKGPHAFARVIPTLDEEDGKSAAVAAEDNTVGSHSRPGIVIGILCHSMSGLS